MVNAKWRVYSASCYPYDFIALLILLNSIWYIFCWLWKLMPENRKRFKFLCFRVVFATEELFAPNTVMLRTVRHRLTVIIIIIKRFLITRILHNAYNITDRYMYCIFHITLICILHYSRLLIRQILWKNITDRIKRKLFIVKHSVRRCIPKYRS